MFHEMCRGRFVRPGIVMTILFVIGPTAPALVEADGPWIITTPVTISRPVELSDVVVGDGGQLTIENVPDPGVRFAGNLMVAGHGSLIVEDSVIQFMSTYHGQYALAVLDDGSAVISGCEYRVPNGVQHALFTGGSGSITIADTNFGSVQLIATGRSTIRASRLDGHFEVIMQDAGRVMLTGIPRDHGRGDLWVWPEFPPGSTAVYSPPEPGFIESWSFPPPGSAGVPDTCRIDRCRVLLWPLLVRAGADLTLAGISENNWVIVGLHLPHSETITGLRNGQTYTHWRVPLDDRTIRLENSSIDTWNLYPESGATVTVQDSVLGEMITSSGARSVLRNTVIDGSGGYFGANQTSTSLARHCTFTCDIQASDDATIELHGCHIRPYPGDTTGTFTRFGAFGRARLFLDGSDAETTAALGEQGLIARTWIDDAPRVPPAPGTVLALSGVAVLDSLPGGPAPGSWQLEAVDEAGHILSVLGRGETSGDHRLLGIWTGLEGPRPSALRLVLTDGWGRTLAGSIDLVTLARRSSRSTRRIVRVP